MPKILLCGNRKEFFARVALRPFKLIGQVKFLEESGHDLLREGKFLLNGKLTDLSELGKMIRGGG